MKAPNDMKKLSNKLARHVVDEYRQFGVGAMFSVLIGAYMNLASALPVGARLEIYRMAADLLLQASDKEEGAKQ